MRVYKRVRNTYSECDICNHVGKVTVIQIEEIERQKKRKNLEIWLCDDCLNKVKEVLNDK